MPFITNPDFWSILASIATILGFAVLIWAAFVALGQLKEMTKTRKLEAMLEVHEMISSEDARGHRRFIYTKLNSPPDQLTAEERSHVEQVSVTFDRIGVLVEHDLIPKEELFDSHCEVIARAWLKLEPYIKFQRQLLGGRHVEHFEKLALAARDYHARHFPDQELDIVNIWGETGKPETDPSQPS